MRSSKTVIQLIALTFALALSAVAYGQDGSASGQSQNAISATQLHPVGNGQQLKIEGIVIKRNADAYVALAFAAALTIIFIAFMRPMKILFDETPPTPPN